MAEAQVETGAPAVAEEASVTSQEKGEEVTEETCDIDFSVKHPLHNKWNVWYDNPGKKVTQQNWENHLKLVMTFDTVEDFWCLFNNIVPPSGLAHGTNYHVFKEGIEPKWEDPSNERGGKWVVPIPKNKKECVDDWWCNLLLGCIGELFEDEDEVCGAVVSIRKAQDRLALWTRTATNEELQKRIGKKLKEVVGVDEKMTIGYQAHGDAMAHNSSYGNSLHYEV